MPTLTELHEDAVARNVLITICMCCKKVLGEKDLDTGRPGVSHGLCDACLDLHYPEDEDEDEK